MRIWKPGTEIKEIGSGFGRPGVEQVLERELALADVRLPDDSESEASARGKEPLVNAVQQVAALVRREGFGVVAAPVGALARNLVRVLP
jgi:hypothetical protein